MQAARPNNHRILILATFLLGAFAMHYSPGAMSKNGFDISNAIIPQNEILQGGPPKDGIPAISNPKLIEAHQADFVAAGDRIVGIKIDGVAKAYPISILNWHEIVNDNIGDWHFAITYCPLCGTAVAFDAMIDGEINEFGVSGLLYNSDVLLYDRKTESLWSQISSSSVAGKRVGKKLKRIPISHTTWKDWLAKHPETLVLSDETGHFRDYSRNPYADYEQSRTLYFAVNNHAPSTYHPKELVVGVDFDGVVKAYPFVELEKNGKASFSDQVNGKQITVNWDKDNRAVTILDEHGKEVAGIQGFWFAWFAFHPETQVFRAESS